MVCVTNPRVENRIVELVSQRQPRPVDLLQMLENEFTYQEIQDGLVDMLNSQRLVLGSDRRLHISPAAEVA